MVSRRSVLFASAALATVSPLRALAQTGTSTPRPGVHGELATIFSANNRPLLMVRSEGGPPAPMIFDTGTSGNALDTPYAELLRLARTGDSHVVDGATGQTMAGAWSTVLRDTNLGGVTAGDQEFDVYPRHAFNEAGIVGPNAFGDRLVQLDLARSQIYVRPATPDAMPVGRAFPYKAHGGSSLPGVDVQLPGLTVEGIMDSGHDGELALPLEMADRIPLEAPPVEVGRAVSVSGSQPVYQARLAGDVTIGPVTLTRPLIRFRGRVPNVGFEILRRMIIVMHPQTQRSWILQPGSARSPLGDYVGRYGQRMVSLEEGRLFLQREGRPRRPMTLFGADLFDVEEPSERIQFVRESGKIVGFDLLGRTLTPVPRS